MGIGGGVRRALMRVRRFWFNGQGGIRTRGTGDSQYDGLANRCLQPLGHLSRVRDESRRVIVALRGRGVKRKGSECSGGERPLAEGLVLCAGGLEDASDEYDAVDLEGGRIECAVEGLEASWGAEAQEGEVGEVALARAGAWVAREAAREAVDEFEHRGRGVGGGGDESDARGVQREGDESLRGEGEGGHAGA